MRLLELTSLLPMYEYISFLCHFVLQLHNQIISTSSLNFEFFTRSIFYFQIQNASFATNKIRIN